jgi:hypothetical protein
MPPFGQAVVTIEYSPSSLEREEATLIIENPTVGQWLYNLIGRGKLPVEPTQVCLVAQVNRSTTTTIAFKNPFLESVHAVITLDAKT